MSSVDVQPGQLYASEAEDGGTHHFLILDVDDGPWSTARAKIYVFEMNETFNVHARTLWRNSVRVV